MESCLPTHAICFFRFETSQKAHNRLSCPRPADSALKTLNLSLLYGQRLAEQRLAVYTCSKKHEQAAHRLPLLLLCGQELAKQAWQG